ncbi:hypothetical protein D3C80_2028000 [compost metagenome]
MTARKEERQEIVSVISPPINGPSSAVTAQTVASTAKTRAIREDEKFAGMRL